MLDGVFAETSNVCIHAIPYGFRLQFAVDIPRDPDGILEEWICSMDLLNFPRILDWFI